MLLMLGPGRVGLLRCPLSVEREVEGEGEGEGVRERERERERERGKGGEREQERDRVDAIDTTALSIGNNATREALVCLSVGRGGGGSTMDIFERHLCTKRLWMVADTCRIRGGGVWRLP
jgi:hypothetical protein